MTTEEENQLIKLAGKTGRKVRTAEGAQFYGLPIGSPISADLIAAKKAEAAAKGVKVPTGAVTGNNKGSFASGAAAATAAAGKPAAAAPSMKLKVKKTSLTGNKKFKIGKAVYSVPNGSKLIKPTGNDQLAYVLTPDGEVHAFNAAGEIETDSKTLFKALATKFSGDLAGDPNYEEVEFDASAATYSIDNMKVGGKLTDPDGVPQFTKQPDGTWKHDLLGAVLEEKDISPLFDAGELIPAKDDQDAVLDTAFAEPEATSFADMPTVEVAKALDDMPEGTVVTYGSNSNTGSGVKQADGEWKIKGDDVPVTSVMLSYTKSSLKVTDGKKPVTEKAQKASEGKAAEKVAPTVKMPKVDWETTYQGNGEYEKSAGSSDFENAAPGDKILVEYFADDDEEHADGNVDLELFVKQEGDNWIDDGGNSYTNAEAANVLTDPNVEAWISNENTGNAVEPEAPAPKEDPYKDLGKGELKDALIADGTLLTDEQAKDNKIKAADDKPKFDFNDGDDVTGKLGELLPGDKVTKKYIPASGSGTSVPATVFTKQDDGKWLMDGNSLAKPVKESVVTDSLGMKGTHKLEFGDTKPKKAETKAAEPEVVEPAPVEAESPTVDPKTLQVGDEVNSGWLDTAPVGAQFKFKTGAGSLVKLDNSDWKSTSNGSLLGTDILKDALGYGPAHIEKLGPDPEPEIVKNPGPKQWAEGDAITSPDDLTSLPAGAVLNYTKKDGKLSTYTKLGNGDFLTPNGNILSAGKMKYPATAGKFTVKEVPVGVPQSAGSDVPNGYKANDPITKFGHLKDFEPGTVVKDAGGPEYTGVSLVKQADGTWVSEKFGAYTANDMSYIVEQEDIYFVSAPAKETEVPDLNTTEYVTSPDKTISFDSTGLAFSTEDLKGALDALESHSGFQIAYAFKDAKDNVFADKDLQNKLKAWGKEKYPNLPPKKAAVQILKDKLGITTQDDADEPQAADGAPEISFGDASPKTTATGLTGGSFSAAEVKEAIDILEAFNGKVFKSELNKKGNPLGTLSPNDLVGFNKDKTITKQKFIDLLKQKLDNHIVQDNSDKPDPLADWEAELLAQGEAMKANDEFWAMDEVDKFADPTTGVADVGLGNIPTKEEFEKLPVGTQVTFMDGGTTYTKAADNPGESEWVFGTDTHVKPSYASSDFEGSYHQLSVTKLPDSPEKIESGNATVDLPVEGSVFTASVEILSDLPENTHIHLTSGTQTSYWKGSNGKWSFQGLGKEGQVQNENFGDIDLKLKSYASTDMASAPSEFEKDLVGKNGPKVGDDVTKENVASLPAGTTATMSSGGKLEKAVNGEWHLNGVTDYGYDNETVADISQKAKITSLPVDKAEGGQSSVSVDDFDGFGVGTKLKFTNSNGGEYVYTKTGDDSWKGEMFDTPLNEDAVKSHVKEVANGEGQFGHYELVSKPDATPAYASTPAAVSDKHASDLDVTVDDVDNAVIGAVFQNSGDSKIYYVKTEDDLWYIMDDGENTGVMGGSSLKKGIEENWLWHVQYDGPEYNKSGLMPGKYSSGGKAYMLVNADGSGVYVNSKGNVSKMTAAKVKKDHAAGMNLYAGLPDTTPTLGEPVKQSATPKKKNKLADLKLEDGTYFDKNPNAPKTTVYEVNGDSVKIFKPISSSVGSNLKIGQKPEKQWIDTSSVGAKIDYDAYGVKTVYTKKAEGWFDSEGNDVTQALANKPYWEWYGHKIVNHGYGEPVESTQAKIQTQIKKGQILDADGNSLVPDGYAGELSLFGTLTNVQTMLAVKKILDDSPDGSTGWATQVKETGLNIPVSTFKPYAVKLKGEYTSDIAKNVLSEKLDAMLSGLDTDVPESDAAQLFEYNAQGDAKFPEAGTATYTSYQSASMSAYIKNVGATFGGGGIIGQHYPKMDKYQKQNWINYFTKGNFKAMYDLEVAAAAASGKPHASGFKHPGYVSNTETHQISWGAAVDGEVSALSKVEGNWSTSDVDPSAEEINNYLISAQMQNPTHLTMSEKRSWVAYHKADHKTYVDNLSVKAKNRKESGESPLSEPIKWTDNVQPAKSYSKLFDDTQYPINWDDYSYVVSNTYLSDNADDEELTKAWNEHKAEHGDYGYNPNYFLNKHFQGLADEAAAQALIPVYTKKPQQKVKKGTHPIFEYSDQFGKSYFFKPRADTKLDKYRSEAEHLGNELGKLFGFKTANSKLLTLDGQYGQLQQDVGGVSDLMGANYGSLSGKQIGDVASEHVLDWLLDNDDTKGDNAKVLPDGSVVGIDKGRAFKHYGAWNGLAANGAMDTNAHTIYSQMFDAIRNGQVSKENADIAYLQMQKRIKRMQKTSDDSIKSLLAEGMKNREGYDLNYAIDGKKLPQNYKGLEAAVLDRKTKLADDFAKVWEGVYADAGYGELPEPPVSPLGDVISGLQHPELHKQVFESKVTGKATMVAGAHIIGGTALTWVDEYKDGSTNLNGEMFLGPKKQQEVLDYLVSNSTNITSGQSMTEGFEVYDNYKLGFVEAAKTINHHTIDGEYNMGKVNTFLASLDNINTEASEWSPNVVSNATLSGEPAFKFSTGKTVPMTHIDQYKLMLDSYQIKGAVIKNAYEMKIKATPHFTAYQAVKVSGNKPKYSAVNGDQLIPTSSGYFFKQSNGIQHVDNDDKVVEAAKGAIASGDTSWVEIHQDEPEVSASMSSQKNNHTNEKKAKWSNFTKVVDKDHTGGVEGSNGHEYELTLPTGEKIFYRNGGNTNTAKGQQGKLMFRADGVTNENDVATAMERIQDQLNAMGILTEDSDENAAELTYWREMYGVLENRKHSATDKLGKTYKEMQKKVKEISQQNAGHFLENLSESMDPADEVSYWRGLWSIHHKEQVDNLIATEGYLPKFDHQNYLNPELETGKPYWERFDVTDEELEAAGAMLMATTGGDPWDRLKSGGLLSAEERLRQLDNFVSGGYGSAGTDQNNGASHNIYTRIMGTEHASSYAIFISPRLMRRTRTYSFGSDNYGNLANRKTGSPGNPLDSIKQFKGNGGNETMLPHAATLLDTIEVAAFDSSAKRDEAIQELKKLGIEQIRGVPVEDRLVMHQNIKAAIEKVKKQWKK